MTRDLLTFIAAVLFGALLVALCPAAHGCPAPVVVAAHAHETVAVVTPATIVTPVTPVVVAVFQPVVVAVPAYGAGYVPPPVAVAPPAPAPGAGAPAEPQRSAAADCAAILTALKGIDARLSKLEKGGAAPTMPPAGPPDPFAPAADTAPPSVPKGFALSCAACHTQGKDDAGGGFALLTAAGGFAPMTDAELALCVRKIQRKQMPPARGAKNPNGVPAPADDQADEMVAALEALKPTK